MQRRAIEVSGIVQGVGFRPFVFGLASRLELRGFVKNRAGNVLIEVEGEVAALDRFLSELQQEPPPLAQIDSLSWQVRPPRHETQFCIDHSDADPSRPVLISPDIGTCDDCLAELLDPKDRRYRYPLLNCTNCGPRLTILRAAPYDRDHTTMAAFEMCSACRTEYECPDDRRFHAQPIAWTAAGSSGQPGPAAGS